MLGMAYVFSEHPRLAAWTFLGTLVVSALFVWALAPSHDEIMAFRAEQAAQDRAKLECAKSGGTYEYFGTQGYHCIGGKK